MGRSLDKLDWQRGKADGHGAPSWALWRSQEACQPQSETVPSLHPFLLPFHQSRGLLSYLQTCWTGDAAMACGWLSHCIAGAVTIQFFITLLVIDLCCMVNKSRWNPSQPLGAIGAHWTPFGPCWGAGPSSEKPAVCLRKQKLGEWAESRLARENYKALRKPKTRQTYGRLRFAQSQPGKATAPYGRIRFSSWPFRAAGSG